jgi:3-isopropylmalate/(R)-2-methylmalate dehydratase small subunit
MRPVTRVTGPALLLPHDNIDTDQLIPARFLRKPRSTGYHNYLLYDARYHLDGTPRKDSPIPEDMASRPIVIAGHNIGCGSSREGAVYALVDFGVQVVISTKVADIFRNNAVRNGLLPITLPKESVDRLMAHCRTDPEASLMVDLETCTIQAGDETLAFEIDDGSRQRLLKGIDDIQATLAWQPQIDAFTRAYRTERPWVTPTRG